MDFLFFSNSQSPFLLKSQLMWLLAQPHFYTKCIFTQNIPKFNFYWASKLKLGYSTHHFILKRKVKCWMQMYIICIYFERNYYSSRKRDQCISRALINAKSKVFRGRGGGCFNESWCCISRPLISVKSKLFQWGYLSAWKCVSLPGWPWVQCW